MKPTISLATNLYTILKLAQVGLIMSKKDLLTVVDTESRDQAARAFERNQNHHAVVVDKNGSFVGIISAWDIAAECVRDDQAWYVNEFVKPAGSTCMRISPKLTHNNNIFPFHTQALEPLARRTLSSSDRGSGALKRVRRVVADDYVCCSRKMMSVCTMECQNKLLVHASVYLNA